MQSFVHVFYSKTVLFWNVMNILKFMFKNIYGPRSIKLQNCFFHYLHHYYLNENSIIITMNWSDWQTISITSTSHPYPVYIVRKECNESSNSEIYLYIEFQGKSVLSLLVNYKIQSMLAAGFANHWWHFQTVVIQIRPP